MNFILEYVYEDGTLVRITDDNYMVTHTTESLIEHGVVSVTLYI